MDEKMENLLSEGSDEKMFNVVFENAGFDNSLLNNAGVVSESTDEKSFVYRAGETIDVRRMLFEESIKQNVPIERFSKVEKTLEEIFRQATT